MEALTLSLDAALLVLGRRQFSCLDCSVKSGMSLWCSYTTSLYPQMPWSNWTIVFQFWLTDSRFMLRGAHCIMYSVSAADTPRLCSLPWYGGGTLGILVPPASLGRLLLPSRTCRLCPWLHTNPAQSPARGFALVCWCLADLGQITCSPSPWGPP